MALQLKLLAASGLGNLPEPPSYAHLVAEDADSNTMWKEVLSAFHVSLRLFCVSIIYFQ